jgi:hypothetical protein
MPARLARAVLSGVIFFVVYWLHMRCGMEWKGFALNGRRLALRL